VDAMADGRSEALLEAGHIHNTIGNYGAAIQVLTTAEQRNPGDKFILTALAKALVGQGLLEPAESYYRKLLTLFPLEPDAHANLASVLEALNRLNECESVLNNAEEIGIPVPLIAVPRAALLKRRGHFRESLEILESMSTLGTDSAQTRWRYALIGQMKDNLGIVDEAFAAFSELNRIASEDQATQIFDKNAFLNRIEKNAKILTKVWIDSWTPRIRDQGENSPVFLLGFPRSGTTLLDTVLFGHEKINVLEERPYIEQLNKMVGGIEKLGTITPNDLIGIREEYFRLLHAENSYSKNTVIIDKMPFHLVLTPLIYRVFPDARFIFALRHPCDVVLSCFMQNFRMNEAMINFLDLEIAAATYDRVMSYWTQCLKLFPLRVHTLTYEAFVVDHEGEIGKLLEFLELPWDGNVLEIQKTALSRGRIGTPSYSQVTEKIYTRAAGRWERYRKYMEPVLPILRPWIKHFGYPDIGDV
jgi:tetratricopeptide (TPR) repeat protein